MSSPTVGYPETVFAAANFFGPAAPSRVGQGVTPTDQDNDGSGPNPKDKLHTLGVIALLVIGGYILYHATYER